jgi:hypothetical protein
VISNGGIAFIYSAGIVSGTDLLSGATVSVYNGGLVRGGLTLSGGKAVISGTVSAGQTIAFAGSGSFLGVDNVADFGATIGAFKAGDTLNLGAFVYSSTETRSFTEAASKTSGTLTVTDGGVSAHLTLLGNYTTSNFVLSKDATAGTDVKFT